MKYIFSLVVIFFISFFWSCSSEKYEINQEAFDKGIANGKLANEGYKRCDRFVNDWLKFKDSDTGLIPRNLHDAKEIWNAKDAAADNYPFMVLTTSFTDRELYEGHMKDMLKTETDLTSRMGNLPDTWSFAKDDFAYEDLDTFRILFGASEYIKDGLLPITEWLGRSPWSERMINMLDDIWKYAPVKTQNGNIPSENVELNGEMLQVLSRVYWMTGDPKYLEWAIRLGDYYLLDNNHPTRNMAHLRLRDHGCEVVSGLCELYMMVNYADPDKKADYREPIHQMLDRILEVGRNEHGLFYNNINPVTGEQIGEGIADTYGYTYNGYYSVYLVDSIKSYHNAVLNTLENLHHYQNYDWESGSADGYADAIESALNLYNREPSENVKNWIDSETRVMWSMQDSSHRQNAEQFRDSGIIEGWHGDGNFARTTIMYNLWKTKGTRAVPWREDLVYGAVMENDTLKIAIKVSDPWEGTLKFDAPRHSLALKLPVDYPRINQFPEWYTVLPEKRYVLVDFIEDSRRVLTGKELIRGIALQVNPGDQYYLEVIEKIICVYNPWPVVCVSLQSCPWSVSHRPLN